MITEILLRHFSTAYPRFFGDLDHKHHIDWIFIIILIVDHIPEV